MAKTKTNASTSTSQQRHSLWQRLYYGETSFDFVGRRWRWVTISAVVILAGLLSLFVRGLNLGIDFEGGTAWEVPTRTVSVPEARDVLGPFGLADARIQVLGADTLRVQVKVEGTGATPQARQADREAKVAQVSEALAQLAGVAPGEVSVNDIGPSWGKEVTKKAQRALILFLIAIAIYITVRFEWKMALATLTAMVHDIAVTVGVYSLTGFEVNPPTVIAFLTILGYSIYDGIVVFDKVEENTRAIAASGRMTYADTVNLSLNQVLMRTLNTSITALLPIASLLVVGSLIFGATTLQDFALALLVGLGASAYSSIFIASPLLAMLKEREARYISVRKKLAVRGGRPPGDRAAAPPLIPAAASSSSSSSAGAVKEGAATKTTSPGASGEADAAARRPPPSAVRTSAGPSRPSTPGRPSPRPRKKGKRR